MSQAEHMREHGIGIPDEVPISVFVDIIVIDSRNGRGACRSRQYPSGWLLSAGRSPGGVGRAGVIAVAGGKTPTKFELVINLLA